MLMCLHVAYASHAQQPVDSSLPALFGTDWQWNVASPPADSGMLCRTKNCIRSSPDPGMPQALCRDARTVPAGGAVEMEVAHQLRELARQESGLEQYAIAQFAAALEVRAEHIRHTAVTAACLSRVSLLLSNSHLQWRCASAASNPCPLCGKPVPCTNLQT